MQMLLWIRRRRHVMSAAEPPVCRFGNGFTEVCNAEVMGMENPSNQLHIQRGSKEVKTACRKNTRRRGCKTDRSAATATRVQTQMTPPP
ncbi:hypothetical protein L596_022234 [Steinernema carpocapsae]|uniref:Uncharacterized protein n=1 Tax=Steinernema carpocapsae TaxID=34508 RepID=A0A4U5ML33_STECR|nr:hypothetical protein L596_022234 [Steinernema carpocapsae]